MGSQRIESIFRGFEEEQSERSQQNSIISIFEQSAEQPAERSAEEKPPAASAIQAVEHQADKLNSEMVVFVEQVLDAVGVNGPAR